jgi:proline iminopeptidase
VLTHFLFGEQRDMDLLPGLARAACPVLVLAGELDPVCPMLGSERIVAALPEAVVQFERFAEAGHGVFRDQPDRAFQVLRDFITGNAGLLDGLPHHDLADGVVVAELDRARTER